MEELNVLDGSVLCNYVCACGAKANSHKAEQDKQLIQFLMGLNEIYSVVRGSILMMNPLPTIAQGFSILIQEEKQREVRPSNQSIIESTSLNVGAHSAGRNQFRTNYTQHTNINNSRGHYNQHQNPGSSGNQSYRINKSQTNRSSQLFCDYCKKQGNTKDKCYRLHGFLADFKFTKGRNAWTTANVHGIGSEPDNNYQNKGQYLTKDQYKQLTRLQDNFQVGNVVEVPQMMLVGLQTLQAP